MEHKNEIHSILIIKPGAIGDLLQLTPIIRALSDNYPRAKITLLVSSRVTATLFQHNTRVAEVIFYDHRDEHRSFSSFMQLWRHLHENKIDLLLQFQRSSLKAWLLATAALPRRILVYHKTRDRLVHVVDNYFATIAPLGISGQNRELELAVSEDERQFADTFFTTNGLNSEVVIALNPGASHPVNRWGTDQYAALADILAQKYAVRSIVVGSKEDQALADEIAIKTSSMPVIATGGMTLLQLGAVLKKCTILVSGDTGPLHLATAVGTRVIALFGAADPARTGPLGTGHCVLQAEHVSCVPCRSRTCANTCYLECMKKISVQMVVNTFLKMVQKKPHDAL